MRYVSKQSVKSMTSDATGVLAREHEQADNIPWNSSSSDQENVLGTYHDGTRRFIQAETINTDVDLNKTQSEGSKTLTTSVEESGNDAVASHEENSERLEALLLGYGKVLPDERPAEVRMEHPVPQIKKTKHFPIDVIGRMMIEDEHIKNYYSSYQNLQSELKLSVAKWEELQLMCSESQKYAIEGLANKEESEQRKVSMSVQTDLDPEEMNWWKIQCEELEMRMTKLQKETSERLREFESEIEQWQKEKCLNQARICYLQDNLRKTNNEKIDLICRLDKTRDDLNYTKFGVVQEKEFQLRLEKRLLALLEEFRNEAAGTDSTSMDKITQLALDGFQAAVKVILAEKPQFQDMLERTATFLEVLFGDEDENNKEVDVRIESMLEMFQERQKEDFAENICNVIDHLELAKQGLDKKLSCHITDLKEIIADKQRNFLNISKEVENINAKVETLFELISQLSQVIKSEGRERGKEMEKLMKEISKLRASYAYVDHLRTENMKLKDQIENRRMALEELKNELRANSGNTAPNMLAASAVCKEEGSKDTATVKKSPLRNPGIFSPNEARLTKEAERRVKSPSSNKVLSGTAKAKHIENTSESSPKSVERLKNRFEKKDTANCYAS